MHGADIPSFSPRPSVCSPPSSCFATTTASVRHLWLGFVFVGATVATHAMIGGLLVVALVLSTGYWVYLAQPTGGASRHSCSA